MTCGQAGNGQPDMKNRINCTKPNADKTLENALERQVRSEV